MNNSFDLALEGMRSTITTATRPNWRKAVGGEYDRQLFDCIQGRLYIRREEGVRPACGGVVYDWPDGYTPGYIYNGNRICVDYGTIRTALVTNDSAVLSYST